MSGEFIIKHQFSHKVTNYSREFVTFSVSSHGNSNLLGRSNKPSGLITVYTYHKGLFWHAICNNYNKRKIDYILKDKKRY